MVVERPLDLVAIRVGVDGEVVRRVDALDHDHAVVLGLDLAGDLTEQVALTGWDLTRLQRASKGAGQSAAGGGDDVVERRRALGLGSGRNAVVLGDAGVDTEHHGLRLGRDMGAAKRTANALDTYA